jgi:uncharacterized DUF497 family protein
MTFVWDPKKNRANIAKHSIAFEDAVKIFDGPTLEQIDDRTDYGEVRTYAIGLVNGFEVVVIYTETAGGERRIISAWRAERNERKAYWEIFS